MSKICPLLGAIEIDSSNNVILLDEAAAVAQTATIASGIYFLRGDLAADDICLAIKTALEAAGASANTYLVNVTTDGSTASWNIAPASSSAIVRVARATGADAFRVRWTNAGTTFPKELLGFAVEKGAADANPELSTLSPAAVWVPNDYYEDSLPIPEWEIAETDLNSGDTDVVKRGDQRDLRRVLLRLLDGRRVYAIRNTADPNATLEKFINRHNDGRRLELHDTTVASGTLLTALSSSTKIGTAWKLGKTSGERLEARRAITGLDHWDHELLLKGWVTG